MKLNLFVNFIPVSIWIFSHFHDIVGSQVWSKWKGRLPCQCNMSIRHLCDKRLVWARHWQTRNRVFVKSLVAISQSLSRLYFKSIVYKPCFTIRFSVLIPNFKSVHANIRFLHKSHGKSKKSKHYEFILFDLGKGQFNG